MWRNKMFNEGKADWVIWYSDGSSYSSLDGPPENAKRTHVICIAIAHISCGNYTIAEQNYYCWHFSTNEWVPHDYQGLMQYLMEPGKEKIVLNGFWINREQYAEIRAGANKDPRLPEVTAGPPRQPEGQDGFI